MNRQSSILNFESLSNKDENSAKVHYFMFYVFRFLEFIIYGSVVYILLGGNVLLDENLFTFEFSPFEDLTSLMQNDGINNIEIFLVLLTKIGFIIPTYFLMRLLNKMVNRIGQRAELYRDNSRRWLFSQKQENEFKSLDERYEHSLEYNKLRFDFIQKTIDLHSKTNFELLEEVTQKTSAKNITQKQIDACLNTFQKIKNIIMPEKK